ncbi:hypothetical protein BD769DRAFT_1539251 [Suillus cothurnatus]|nr:hypothetical protein BD769DRAFT_1539251 [Suillus cothurnatus]
MILFTLSTSCFLEPTLGNFIDQRYIFILLRSPSIEHMSAIDHTFSTSRVSQWLHRRPREVQTVTEYSGLAHFQ